MSCPHPKDSSSPAARLQKNGLCCPLPDSWLRAQSPWNFLGDRSDFVPTRRLLVAPQELQNRHLAPERPGVAGGSGLSAPPVISRTGTGHAVWPTAGPESGCWAGVLGLGRCTPRCQGQTPCTSASNAPLCTHSSGRLAAPPCFLSHSSKSLNPRRGRGLPDLWPLGQK